jgi:transcription elongation factor Elf1
MHNDKFTVYPGKFPCKTCGEEVKSLRLLKENGNATWMCSKKHLSVVGLIPIKKKKKDYEREV